MVKSFSIIAGYHTGEGFVPKNDCGLVIVKARDERSALRKYRRHHTMSVGMYEIFRSNAIWILSSSYGVDFIAIPA